jgi:hypothetical protein
MAQLSPDDLKKLAELYKSIDGYTESAAQAAAALADANGRAANELIRLEKEWAKLMKDIGGSREAFSNIVDEIKGMNSGVNQAAKAFRGLGGLAAKLQSHQEGINRLSSKELETLQKRARERVTDLELAKKISKQQIEDLIRLRHRGPEEKKQLLNAITTHRNIEAQIGKSNSSLDFFQKQLKEAIKNSQEIENALGNTGALLKGISKIPFLANLPGMSDVLGKVEEDIAKIQEEEGKTVSKTEAMGMAFKKMGPVIGKALIDPMTGVTFLAKQIFDAFKAIDAGAGELAKNNNMSYNSALKLREEFTSIATNSNDAALSGKRLSDTYNAIGASLGANADINQADLETFTKLREQAGYTNEELTSMYKMSLVTGKSIEDTTSEFLGGAKALAAQKGLSINVKQLMKETAGASNTIKLSLGGSAKELAEAAVAAKALGSDLSKVEAISGKLLNFEDSISAELEAELLTGKQINLETARLAALNNDMATVAEEIKNEIGGSAEFTKMNRIQQEAFAAAVGMSREELANTLVEQEALQRVGAKTGEEAKAKYDLLRQTMTAEQAAASLGDKELAKQYEQQSVAEKFQQAVEKIKDIFVTIVDGPFGAMLSGFSSMLSNVGILKGILAGAGIVLAAMAVNAIMTASALTLGVGLAAVLTGAAVAFAAQDSATQKAQSQAGSVKSVNLNDGAIAPPGVDPNGGIVASLPKGGIIAQYGKDDYLVGTTNKPGSGGGNFNEESFVRSIINGITTGMSKVTINSSLKVNEKEIANASNTGNLVLAGALQ